MLLRVAADLQKQITEGQKRYSCEAQFQFELAWELKKYFELQKKNDYHVFLEYPSQDKDRKRYDIVIRKDNAHCVIELKYKTKDQPDLYYDGVAVELKNQAAQDLGRYDFLKDVMRIESFEENNPNKKLDCGYAVLLANDSTYWEREGSTTLYRDFSLYNKREIPNTSLKWNWKDEVKESTVGKNRVDELNIKGHYTVNWQPFNDKFKYLIFKI